MGCLRGVVGHWLMGPLVSTVMVDCVYGMGYGGENGTCQFLDLSILQVKTSEQGDRR